MSQNEFADPLIGTGPPTGPRTFADGQRFDVPFYYDPSAGNQLFEFVTFRDSPTSPYIEVQPDVGPGVNILVEHFDPLAAAGLKGIPPRGNDSCVKRTKMIASRGTGPFISVYGWLACLELCLPTGKASRPRSGGSPLFR